MTCFVETHIARRFFDEEVRLARKDKLLSSDQFAVGGTLIDAWASFKSFKRKDDDEPPKPRDGTGMVDFKGERCSSTTRCGYAFAERQCPACLKARRTMYCRQQENSSWIKHNSTG